MRAEGSVLLPLLVGASSCRFPGSGGAAYMEVPEALTATGILAPYVDVLPFISHSKKLSTVVSAE